MELLRATYRVAVEEKRVEQRAEALGLEQTVELPRACVKDPFVKREILPRIDAIEPDPEGGFQVTLNYPVGTTALDPAQLLNVLLGNASLQDDVTLLDVDLGSTLAQALAGPRFGIEGIREATGIHDRPLTCAALKPMGLSPDELGNLCATFARAGIDVIKDDHGLADAPFCPFEARVRACQVAVERVAADTGHRALYAPNLIGTPSTIDRQLRVAQEEGVGAVVTAPFLIGMPVFWEMCHGRASVPVLAHPALTGGPRIATAMLLGTLFRVYGADAVVFPHSGGRFPFSPDLCGKLAERMRRPWEAIRPTLPIPAGGMSIERVRELIEFYGTDVMLLVGGSLYEAGSALEERGREFVEGIRKTARRASGISS